MEAWHVLVREPDMHHNHWGLEFHLATEDVTNALKRAGARWCEFDPLEVDSCFSFTMLVNRFTKDGFFSGPGWPERWNMFHQGGCHCFGERCQNWHYFEFWALPGDEDHRGFVIRLVREIQDNLKE